MLSCCSISHWSRVIGAPGSSMTVMDVALAAHFKHGKTISGRGMYMKPKSDLDPETGAMDPDSTEAHACTVADVEVDTETGHVRVLRLASAYEIGCAINPTLVEVTRRNISIWESRQQTTILSPLVLREADATRVELPREPILAHLFHPFEDRLLRRFLRHVERDLARHPRPF